MRPTTGDPRRFDSDGALVDALRDEILGGGPITFARFMERALYAPGLGYYAGPDPRPGRTGDFLTSPEAHGLFGRTMARQVAECWHRLGDPSPFTVRDYGAGSGALAAAILAGLRDEAPAAYAATTYEPVELNPWRVAELRERLQHDGMGDRLGAAAGSGRYTKGGSAMDSVRDAAPGSGTHSEAGGALDAAPHSAAGSSAGPVRGPLGAGQDEPGASDDAAAASSGAPFTGVVLANEFLDALPVHRIERRGGRLVEIGVGWRDGWFADEPMPVLSGGIDACLGPDGARLREGQRTEVNPGIGVWVRALARDMARGWVVVVDYGMPADRLRASERFGGTLKGVAAQRVEHDPYARVGRQDLTAHVDLTALEREAVNAGFDVAGSTTQAQFLANLGMGSLLVAAQGRAGSVAQALETRSAARWLLDPRGTGGFAVVVLGRDAPRDPPLTGLARAKRPDEAPDAGDQQG